MKSKTFCFDLTLLRKNATRYLPLWLLYFLLWLLVEPFLLLNLDADTPLYYIYSGLLDVGDNMIPVVSMLYAILVAMLLYHFLTNARASSAMHALPLRRETLFLETYVTGILFMLVPQLVILGLNTAVLGARGRLVMQPLLALFGQQCLTYLFFFSLATFCFMLSSQMLVAPVIYGIFNFLVIGVEFFIRSLLQLFMYGMGSFQIKLTAFSPIVKILGSYTSFFDEASLNVTYQGWRYLGILAGVAVALTAISLLLFRVRHVEAAGDAITFRVLRPVFKYAVTFGFAITLGLLLSMIVSDAVQSFWSVLLCMIFSAFIGYFLSEMLLQKTVRVFTHHWAGFGAACLVILLGLGSCQLDIYGYTTRVPDVSTVKSVTLTGGAWDSVTLSDRASVASAIELHKLAIEDRKELERDSPYYGHMYIELVYQLDSGRQLAREYNIPYGEYSRLAEAYAALRNTEQARIATLLPSDVDSSYRLDSCSFEWNSEDYGEYNAYDFSSTETAQLLEAVRLDIHENGVGINEMWLVDMFPSTKAVETDTLYYGDLHFTYQRGLSHIYRTLPIYSNCTHTLAVLESISGVELIAH